MIAIRQAGLVAACIVALLAGCSRNGGDDAATRDTGEGTQVATDAETQPRTVTLWMPASAEVVFMSSRGGDTEIYSASGPGGDWTNLTNSPGGDNWPVWSFDGATIAFQSSREDKLDIYTMNADGTGLTRLTDHPEHDYLPAWSPDGTRLTFASWRREPGDSAQMNHIYIMEADGSEQRRLFPWSPGTSTAAVWAPDGRTFAMARKYGEQAADIVIVDHNGEVLRRLTDDAATNGAAAFSPNGRQVAFHADFGDRSEIVVMDVDGDGRSVVVAGGKNWYPDWSPDGRYLIYTAVSPGGGEDNLDVMAVPSNGGEAVTVAGGPDREAEGRWRPFH